MIALVIALIAAQDSTTTCQRVLGQVRCDTRAKPDLDYGKLLEAGRESVPDWRAGDIQEENLKALRMRNRLMEQQLDRESASSANFNQCRSTAMNALKNRELTLARDILDQCAGVAP